MALSLPIGIGLTLLAGLMSGNCMLPMKFNRYWKWENTWFKGTGRSIENEIYFNTAQKPLIESPNGIFSMSEESIAANLEALSKVGIKGTREMFDTTLLAEL